MESANPYGAGLCARAASSPLPAVGHSYMDNYIIILCLYLRVNMRVFDIPVKAQPCSHMGSILTFYLLSACCLYFTLYFKSIKELPVIADTTFGVRAYYIGP